MKIGVGPVHDKRVTKVVKPSQKVKVQTIELEATASGAWPLKMQLMGTGRYELGEITYSIQ